MSNPCNNYSLWEGQKCRIGSPRISPSSLCKFYIRQANQCMSSWWLQMLWQKYVWSLPQPDQLFCDLGLWWWYMNHILQYRYQVAIFKQLCSREVGRLAACRLLYYWWVSLLMMITPDVNGEVVLQWRLGEWLGAYWALLVAVGVHWGVRGKCVVYGKYLEWITD